SLEACAVVRRTQRGDQLTVAAANLRDRLGDPVVGSPVGAQAADVSDERDPVGGSARGQGGWRPRWRDLRPSTCGTGLNQQQQADDQDEDGGGQVPKG